MTRWFPMILTLNPVLDLHSGVKVLVMASMFKGRLVRNLATMSWSMVAYLLFKRRPWPFLSNRDNELQCFIKSSIIGRRQPEETRPMFPKTQKEETPSLAIAMLSQGTHSPSKEGTTMPHPVKSFQRENSSQTRATAYLYRLIFNYLKILIHSPIIKISLK